MQHRNNKHNQENNKLGIGWIILAIIVLFIGGSLIGGPIVIVFGFSLIIIISIIIGIIGFPWIVFGLMIVGIILSVIVGIQQSPMAWEVQSPNRIVHWN